MSNDVKDEKKSIFSKDITSKINWWLAKYPKDQRQSAVIPGLHLLQDENGGHLTTELMDQLAEFIGMPNVSVYEVSKFYSMYEHEAIGKHKLNICTNISCMLRGSKEIITHIENKLDIKMGQSTADGKFTLRAVECQGACCGAPMLEVGKQFHENLTIEKVDKLLEGLE
ncbi:MAG: NADH-quinone oxidoreductase subunit E [Francisellaceae bacterium]|jgi:NADH-quinone oxidoreductase subunit E